jgi:pyruvate dehydrogenase E2 component (dihydrolipoamide acetyltransferase)
MGAIREIFVPDLGDFKDVPIIEVFVKPGDPVKPEDPLVTLESDKATMDVPSPLGGVVHEVKVKLGDRVSEGSLLLMLEVVATTAAAAEPRRPAVHPSPAPVSTPAGVADVRVPHIGDFKNVPVIEVFVKPGDSVKPEQSVITLESDKATMEVPSPLGGVVQELKVKIGDRVSEGTIILTLLTEAAAPTAPPPAAALLTAAPELATSGAAPPASVSSSVVARPAPVAPSPAAGRPAAASILRGSVNEAAFAIAYAGPSVRRLARELRVDLSKVSGRGPKGRILHEDVEAFARGAPAMPAAAPVVPSAGPAIAAAAGLTLLPWPQVDFTKFGPVETQPLARIRRISAANLHRNWVMIPHVTNNDEADITELEAFRVQLNREQEKAGVRVTMLAFLIKASVAALRRFPEFNSSLAPDGEHLILKKFYNIGFAADTPNGLVVPVIKDVDQKGVLAIAKETADLARLAREGKLKLADMQGATFTISSLGGIGGTDFTPIINAPEVAILGVSRSTTKPVWDGQQFVPRLMLPLSLSWDHRVIDGAGAARFNAFLAGLLADARRMLL